MTLLKAASIGRNSLASSTNLKLLSGGSSIYGLTTVSSPKCHVPTSISSLSSCELAVARRFYQAVRHEVTSTPVSRTGMLWAAGVLSLSYMVYSTPAYCKWFRTAKKDLVSDQDSHPSQEPMGTDKPSEDIGTDVKPIEDSKAHSSDIRATKKLEYSNDADNNPLWRSKQSRPFDKKFNETAIFCGNSNMTLARNIADCLGTKLGEFY